MVLEEWALEAITSTEILLQDLAPKDFRITFLTLPNEFQCLGGVQFSKKQTTNTLMQ